MKLKHKPFAHQQESWEQTRDLESFGLFWEMGCGKSKTTIDTAAWLFDQGKITGLLVVAPNGVHANWTTDELPAHMPDCVPWHSCCYVSKRSATKRHQRAVQRVLEPAQGLAVLVMPYSGIMTKRGREAARAFLKAHTCLMVLDESTRIKTPGAKRTKAILAAAKLAPYRRILTGTPVANGPFDVYSQIRFLDLDFWKRHGLGTFTVFKRTFGVFEQMWAGDRQFQTLKYYKDLPALHSIIAEISDRRLKSEVLDLPAKMYSRRTFELSSKQRKLYEELKEQLILELDQEGNTSSDYDDVHTTVVAAQPIVQLLRLQQITCNYLPVDDTGKFLDIEENNPRIELLQAICEDIPHQAIIWARFQRDIDQIMALLGKDAVQYDGRTPPEERIEARTRFQEGKVKWFVANPAAAGEGLTLHAARTVIYYNNSFNLSHRLQSEDRAHRIGQEHPVQYVDIVAENTVDERIVKKLRDKHNIAAEVTGDGIREWL